jgi:hypothetical protein
VAEIIRCDGGCGAESPDPKTKLYVANHWMTLIIQREGGDKQWHRHLLCENCAKKNIFLPARGQWVDRDRGFASDVLR